jgi:excisionase family DNA binding protein
MRKGDRLGSEQVQDAARMVEEGAVGLAGARQFSGLSRSFLYALMDRGDLKYTKVGRRRLVPISELRRILREGLVGVQPAEPAGV